MEQKILYSIETFVCGIYDMGSLLCGSNRHIRPIFGSQVRRITPFDSFSSNKPKDSCPENFNLETKDMDFFDEIRDIQYKDNMRNSQGIDNRSKGEKDKARSKSSRNSKHSNRASSNEHTMNYDNTPERLRMSPDNTIPDDLYIHIDGVEDTGESHILDSFPNDDLAKTLQKVYFIRNEFVSEVLGSNDITSDLDAKIVSYANEKEGFKRIINFFRDKIDIMTKKRILEYVSNLGLMNAFYRNMSHTVIKVWLGISSQKADLKVWDLFKDIYMNKTCYPDIYNDYRVAYTLSLIIDRKMDSLTIPKLFN